jgi:hypothetical protein
VLNANILLNLGNVVVVDSLETVNLDVILLKRVFTHLGLVLVGKEVHDLGTVVAL